MKAADYGTDTNAAAAFVSTNSICQGQQVPILWPINLRNGHEISFRSHLFQMGKSCSHNAGVTVVIVGISIMRVEPGSFSRFPKTASDCREVDNINAYLVPTADDRS